MEDGISKEARAEFLKNQREQRKANRKKGQTSWASRAGPSQPSGGVCVGVSTLRTSAPTEMPSTTRDAPCGLAARLTPPPLESTGMMPPVGELDEDAVGHPPAHQGNSTQAGDVSAAHATAVMPRPPPPPIMFNPTAVPPPIAPRHAAGVEGSRPQAPMHPSIAFNVNETVERALTEARRDAGVAERRATFWKCRFRDLALWAASFVVLSYASDHSFEDG